MSGSAGIDAQAAHLPLDPMPDAPPEIAAAWIERLAKGALLGLWVLPFACCQLLGLVTVPLSAIFTVPVLLVLQIIIAWLVTSPDPGNARWCICLRWGVMIGALASLIIHPIALAPMLGLKFSPQVTPYLAVAFAVLVCVCTWPPSPRSVGIFLACQGGLATGRCELISAFSNGFARPRLCLCC